MYQLTYDSKILFDPYMQSTAITDAKYTGKSNSVSYLDFTIAPNHPLYNTIEKDKGLVEFYSDNVLKFRGKINEIEIDDYGYKIVSCNSVLQYLNHTRVRSYSTVPGDADLTAPTSVEGYFQWLIDQHNLHVKDASERFEVGVNQGAALDKNDYILRSNDNYPTTLDEINDKVLDNLGGYLFVEYKDDRNILNLYADVHSTNSQIIDFGSNILSISYKENDDELYTVVIPRGGTPEKKEGDTKDPKPINIKNLPDNTFDTDSDIVKSGDCVYSLSATKRYGYREYYYSNNDILDPSNLLKAAVLQLRLQMSPKVTIETKAIDLSIAYPGYEQLNIGDACRVRSARHNLDDYFMLSEMELDLNDPSQTTYTFGDEYVSLVGRQSNYLKQINSSIDRNYEDVNTAMSYGKAAAKLADTANKTADAANNTAVKANDKAQKATEDAFNANTTANKAQTTANTANTTANEAQTTANAANSTADKAQATATEAKTNADSANKAAEELKKKTEEIDKQVEAVYNAADAASTKADQVRTDLTQQVQNVKSEMDTAVEAAQTSANKAQSAADAAQKAADKANASTVDLDKSIKAVDAKAIAAKQAAAEAQSKAENVASDLDSANAVIEQHTTELGELTTKVSNAVKKSDSALSVSTEAKQTATEASTTATSAYTDAQTALTQSTTATQTATAAKTTAESASKTASDSLKQSSAAVQTANQISTTLSTEYQTKADADKLYATQSSLKQTSDSITASVSKTYATKDALSALQNVADNAIESWRGTGVPTLTNKPASDWTTNADKKKHSGDLYYDKSTGKAYRFGSDDGETYTWELNQDTDVTKALEDAANAQTSANNAQASATAANTAAGMAQSTANTAVSNAATAKNAADAAQSSANKAQGDVDKLKIDIPETYATKSSLTQTAESITANVESVKTTANSAVTAASNAQQTADAISVNLTENYQTKSQADTIYATKASLKATSDSISAEVTKAQGTANGAVTAASKAQQTADAVTLNLSKNYNTKAQNDALYATQTSLKATSDSISSTIQLVTKDVDRLGTSSQNYITNPQFKSGNTDKVANTLMEASDPDAGKLPGTATTYGKSISGYDNICNNVRIKGIPGHTYRIEIDAKPCSDNNANEGLGLFFWIFTADNPDHPHNNYTSYNANLIPSSVTDWTHAKYDYVFPSNSDFKVIRPAYRTPPSHHWLVTNFTCTDITAISQVSTTASNALTKASTVEQNLNGFKTTVAETYQTKSGMSAYATNSALTQTANSIKAEVTEVSNTANGAVTAASKAQQTADAVTLNLSKNYNTKAQNDALYATQTSLKATSDSISSTIQLVTKDVDRLGTSSQNYITNPQFKSGNTDKVANTLMEASDPDAGKLPGTATTYGKSISGYDNICNNVRIKGIPGHTYRIEIDAKPCSDNNANEGLGLFFWIFTADNPDHPHNNYTSYNANLIPSSVTDWTHAKYDYVFPSNSDFKVIRPAYRTPPSHHWLVTNFTCTDITAISQVSTTASNALTKASTVEQNLNGFKTTVAETYTTKNDFNNLTIGGRNLLLNSNFSKGTDNWVLELHSYGLGTVKAEALSGFGFATTMLTINVTKSTTNLCRIYQLRSPNPMRTDTVDTVSFWANASETVPVQFGRYDDHRFITVQKGWHYYKTTVPKWNGSNAFVIGFKNGFIGTLNITNIMWEHASKASQWSPAPEDLQPAGDYSTKSYVDQTAKSVALGVVQNYKGSDGSGLATKSDITVAKDSITTTVSETYQTKADMKNYATQSQLTQTNDKVTIAFQNSQSVGGQNLLLKTSVPTIVTGSGGANQCVAYYSLAAGNLSNLPTGMYHIQFKIKSDTAGGTAKPLWNGSPWTIPNSNAIDIGTSEQTYSKTVYISNTNHPNVNKIGVRLDNAKGKVTIREMKLERGNSMTPWTAAPEDTMNDLTNAVQNQAVDIAGKVSNDDYTGYVNATNKNLKDIQSSQQHLSDSISNEITLRESYIQFGQDASNPYMDMGNSSSPNKMRLTNTKLSFTSNNIEVASVSNDKMRISNAEVLQSFRIGNFVWQPRSDGHMALKYSPEV